MPSQGTPILEAEAVDSGYTARSVIENFTLSVTPGEVIALIGPNGAGKSSLLKVLFGLLPIWAGSIHVDGSIVDKYTPIKACRSGFVLAPQSSRVFPYLTVRENLLLGCRSASEGATSSYIDSALELFPNLKSLLPRMAGSLSGGEQQCVNLARCFAGMPRIVLLDEPFLGLSPHMSERVFFLIGEMQQRDTSFLIVEQKIQFVLRIATTVIGMKLGRACFNSPPAVLVEQPHRLLELFLH